MFHLLFLLIGIICANHTSQHDIAESQILAIINIGIKKVAAKIRVKIRVKRLMIRMIRIMMILRVTRVIHMKKMIEITSTSTNTRTGTRTIINVTIAFQSRE